MKSDIELRHLTYFACVADELHFGRAAERLGIAQAPLSQQIRQLEERVGAKLFHRTTRRVTLTSAGETFLGHAQDILRSMHRAVSHTRSISDVQTGTITVGGVHIAMSHYLPPIIAAFRQDYPAMTVNVVPLGTAEQLRTLEGGTINVAFIRPTTTTSFMQVEPIAREGFVAVVPRTHRLAQQERVRLADFAGEPMIAYRPILGASYNRTALDALRAIGIAPRVVQEASHTLSVVTLVAAGLGIAMVPSWVRTMRSPHVVHRDLEDLPRDVELAVAWPRGETSPVVLDFVETSRRVAAGVATDWSL